MGQQRVTLQRTVRPYRQRVSRREQPFVAAFDVAAYEAQEQEAQQPFAGNDEHAEANGFPEEAEEAGTFGHQQQHIPRHPLQPNGNEVNHNLVGYEGARMGAPFAPVGAPLQFAAGQAYGIPSAG